jgi:hypothetical protein
MHSNFPLTVITPESAKKDKMGLCDRVWELERPAQIADCVRVAVLHKYGGMWIDADTVCINKLDCVFDHMAKTEFTCVIDDTTGIPYNGFIASRAGESITGGWLEQINKVLRDTVNFAEVAVKFHTFGSEMLRSIPKNSYAPMPMPWFFPFNFSNGNGKIFHEPIDIQSCITSETKCIALSNSWLSSRPGFPYQRPVKEIAEDRNLMGSIMRYALERRK